MRNISFTLTTQQVRERTKTVTRRRSWWGLKPGTLLRAVDKCQGLRRGQHPQQLAVIRVVSAKVERLDEIDATDVVREGFPHLSPAEFVQMYCDHMRCEPYEPVMRIEFEYVNEEVAR